jgi:hypothetical protein
MWNSAGNMNLSLALRAMLGSDQAYYASERFTYFRQRLLARDVLARDTKGPDIWDYHIYR